MFKRMMLGLLLLFAVGMLVACGAQDAPAPSATSAPAQEAVSGDCASEEVFCIGLVTDVGQVDDKSFNQSAWEGVLAAERELGARVDFIETRDATDYAENIGLFIGQNYDVIVTVGFALGEATAEAAAANPDIAFIGVDQFQGEEMANVTGLIFNEAQAGYLAGALAAMMSETGTIAAVLGTDLVPPVVAFKEGYDSGAAAMNPDINLISTYHPGGLDVAFTDPEWGAATAKQAIDQGADVIFGAGGNTGNGALIEVAGNPGVFCIGVDTDQWETLPAAHPCLISSAMKLITPGVLDITTAIYNGQQPAGNFVGEVGLAPFHDFSDVIPADVQETLVELDAGLRDGSITP